MHAARALRSYRTVSVESASPARLLDELLNRLLRDCASARDCILAKDIAGKGQHIGHGLAIVGELIAALDFSVAPDLCAQLASLYQFVIDRLSDANVRRDVAPLAEAEKIIKTLREAFSGVGAP
jgi:flagellar secretion chaperone FliS